MNPEQHGGEFGQTGHENSLPEQPEKQTPPQTQPESEAGIRPDDPESKKALIRLNKLRAEGADADTIHQAENAVAEASQAEQQVAADAARAEIAQIHASIPEQSTPYPVHTTKNMAQRPVAVNLTPPPASLQSGTSHLYGSQLAEHVRQLTHTR